MTYSHSIQLQPAGLQVHGRQPSELQRAEALQDQFGLRVAAHLSQGTSELPYDISERLRAARVQSLAKRKLSPSTPSATVAPGRAAPLSRGDESPGFWGRMAAVLPLVALVAGLVAINVVQSEDRANELAEVDTALLTDDLPPSAYADPGFVQFLRAGSDRANP
ncbi:MAG: DUF3619 family protein [Comamonadaceae bacterium]|nr:MAG: DUF3619 family protein [Comamonadaceae bacterium]